MVLSRSVRVVSPIVIASALLATGCGGGDDGKSAQTRAAQQGGPPGGYTAAQLREALPVELVGYRRVGEPEAGEYGALRGIQNFNQLRNEITYDKPRCREMTGAATASDASLRAVPAAVVQFAKGPGQSASATLMSVPDEVAERYVRVRAPEDCKRFRTRVGPRWSDHQVVEAGAGNVGMASRILGVSTTSGDTAVNTWYAVMRGRGYLATVAVYGPKVTRAEAEQLARQTYDHAERILP
ncbi:MULTISPECIES: hypothetical protein [Thermomonospora]|uniref:PknH-like extracellular domain-containing protein n=1 Tax=Thermomonospora cellulosilytica TaxID=1411118 RepID=A0A7W3MV12_9ACTN|nr:MULTISPECIES: hypothetical protein [Thermomonospora]MBA9002405.1 hypothetical protein [Thermomonospora cellulosilytica]